MAIALESPYMRAEKMATDLAFYGRVRPVQEISDRICAVSLRDVEEIVCDMLEAHPCLIQCGSVKQSPSLDDFTQMLSSGG